MIDASHNWNIKVVPLIVGFILSLVLTFVAYYSAAEHTYAYHTNVVLLLVLATVQGVGQMVFFLHLGIESRPRWKLMMFLFMLLIMLVIVCGSIWIMKNLSYNLMLPMEH